MKINIICVGKKHLIELRDAINTYETRLKPNFDISWQIIPTGVGDGLLQKERESKKVVSLIRANDFVILLDESGTIFTNQQLAGILSVALKERTKNRIIFIIGGAYGVSKELKNRADIIWSLSKLVFPHQIVRLILIEQLYRTSTILQSHPYHHK